MKHTFLFAVIFLILFAAVLASCTQIGIDTDNSGTPTPPIVPEGAIACTDPRPESCIALFDPVCGNNGKTYSNSCVACSDSSVKYSTSGECADARSR